HGGRGHHAPEDAGGHPCPTQAGEGRRSRHHGGADLLLGLLLGPGLPTRGHVGGHAEQRRFEDVERLCLRLVFDDRHRRIPPPTWWVNADSMDEFSGTCTTWQPRPAARARDIGSDSSHTIFTTTTDAPRSSTNRMREAISWSRWGVTMTKCEPRRASPMRNCAAPVSGVLDIWTMASSSSIR